MAIIKSSSDHLTINADGASKDIKFQANGVEVASISSSGNLTYSGTNTASRTANDNTPTAVFTAATTSTSADYYKYGVVGKATSVLDGWSRGYGVTGLVSGATIHKAVGVYAALDTTLPTTSVDTALYAHGKSVGYAGIFEGGNVGIGTTTPSYTLEIGDTSTKGYSVALENNTAKHRHRASATDTQWAWEFANPNGVVGSIKTVSSATQFNTSSDYRLKEDVKPMTGSIDTLKLLKPCNFAWKVDGTRTDGFLAHEAQEVVPEAITGTKDAMMTEEYEVTPAVMDGEDIVTEAVMGEREVPDMQGIDQSKLVPLLVASLQEAVARIEVLEAQLKA